MKRDTDNGMIYRSGCEKWKDEEANAHLFGFSGNILKSLVLR